MSTSRPARPVAGSCPIPRRSLFGVGLLLLITGALQANTDWTGSTSSDWFDASNWTSGVPDDRDKVKIVAGLPNYPVLDAAGAEVKDLDIESGATLDLDTSTLAIHGALIAQADDVSLATDSGTLLFAGKGEGSIRGALSFDGGIRLEKFRPNHKLTVDGDLSVDDIILGFGTLEATERNGTDATPLPGGP